MFATLVMLSYIRRRGLSFLSINGTKYEIPYQGSKILAVFEKHGIPIKYDCRKGTCKSCVIKVTMEGESLETLACMEEAVEGMDICTAGLQPDEIKVVIPPMETKRVTTRKIVAKPQSEVAKANSKVTRLLSQAQECALDGDWEHCADYTEELLEILRDFDRPEDVQHVFMNGPARDLLRDFIACLKGSTSDRAFNLGKKLNSEINKSIT